MTETVPCSEREITPGPRAIAIGAFDGVHLGHQAVVAAVVRAAGQLGVPAAALTFEPTPRQCFAKEEAAQRRLTPDPERVALLCGLGVEQVLVQAFDDGLRRMTPEQFAREIVVERLQAQLVVIGASHSFGANRAGGPELMAALGKQLGFVTEIVPLVDMAGLTVSSTAVRKALGLGDAALASRLLGRPYLICGRVVRGAGVGKALGSPTANLDVPAEKLLPAQGVYAGAAIVSGAAAAPAAVVIGPAPTVDIHELRVEVHLIGFTGDLYGHKLVVGLLRRLRGIETFATREALAEQIERDLSDTGGIFAEADTSALGRLSGCE